MKEAGRTRLKSAADGVMSLRQGNPDTRCREVGRPCFLDPISTPWVLALDVPICNPEIGALPTGRSVRLGRKWDTPMSEDGHSNAESASGLLDYESAARFLGVSPRLVRELWQRRELTGVKVGRRVRFTQADLNDYVTRHRVEAMR
jgi:excisionase family DNA binding protein